MPNLTKSEIQSIASLLVARCPDLASEINAIAAQACGSSARVQYVEVTYRDGSQTVMTAEEYQRLTATDLAHSDLKMLSDTEAAQRLRMV